MSVGQLCCLNSAWLFIPVPMEKPSMTEQSQPSSIFLLLLPLHSPVTWYSYNPLRHVLMFWIFFPFCGVVVLTHSLSPTCFSTPSTFVCFLSPQREREKWWTSVGLVAAILWICCLFVCLCSSTQQQHDNMCPCLLAAVATHLITCILSDGDCIGSTCEHAVICLSIAFITGCDFVCTV